MSEHLIHQAAKWFDDIETWNSLVEMASLKDSIESIWLHQATEGLRQRFLQNPREGWSFCEWGNRIDTWWFLTEFGPESVGIGYGWRYHLCLGVAFGGRVNREHLTGALETEKYAGLRRAFGRIDNRGWQGYPLEQFGDFHFGSVRDGHLPPHELAGYAKFESAKFVDQALAKLEAFMNPQTTDLLRSLNVELLK